MFMINVQTLKGFRDFLPLEIKKREYVLNTLKKVFESYGFEPLETPALEYEEILTGKYGDEGDKLMYKFKDLGNRDVALRYDQTVPLARVIAQYQNELPLPFKRYQIQNVWRAENTQKGRYREFLQVDADIVGVYSPLADAEIIALAIKSLEALKFKNFKVFVNDVKSFQQTKSYFKTSFDIPSDKITLAIRAFDKYKKIGKEGVKDELLRCGFTEEESKDLLKNIEGVIQPTDNLNEIISVVKKMEINVPIISSRLARGLDYYTGMIFEIEIDGYDAGSIAGGGRYDNLIGIFANKDIPAVGFSFGFDRLIESMEELGLFPKNLGTKNVLVAFSSPDLQEKALEITIKLRDKEVNAEYYLEDASLEKQLKYADKKAIAYVIIVNENDFIFKDMGKRTQENLSLDNIIKKLK